MNFTLLRNYIKKKENNTNISRINFIFESDILLIKKYIIYYNIYIFTIFDIKWNYCFDIIINWILLKSMTDYILIARLKSENLENGNHIVFKT